MQYMSFDDVNAETKNILIQNAYESYINTLVINSAFVLLLYTTVLKIPEEREYIWQMQFNLPTWLYFFTRYGSLVQQAHVVAYTLVPSISMMSCDIINYMQLFWFAVSFTGTQGLLIARAYSLCSENRILAVVLAVGFALGLILSVISLVPFSLCATNTALTVLQTLASFLQNFFVVLTDLVVFGICMRKVWSIWRFGIRSPSNLISIIFRQSILRSCFVVSTSTFLAIFAVIARNSKLSLFVLDIGNILQNSLSAILVADFTLDLRLRNFSSIEIINVEVPAFRFRNLLQHIHQSFLVEMRTPGDLEIEDKCVSSSDCQSSDSYQQSASVHV